MKFRWFLIVGRQHAVFSCSWRDGFRLLQALLLVSKNIYLSWEAADRFDSSCGLSGHSMLIAAVGQGGVPFVVNWIFSFLISLILSYRVVKIFRYRHQPFTLVGVECAQEGVIMSAIRRRQVTRSLHWVLKRRCNWRLLTNFCAKIMYSFYLRKYLRHFFSKKVKFIRNIYKNGSFLAEKEYFPYILARSILF